MPSFGIARKRRGSGRMMGSSLGRLFGACWGSEKCSGELEKSIMNYTMNRIECCQSLFLNIYQATMRCFVFYVRQDLLHVAHNFVHKLLAPFCQFAPGAFYRVSIRRSSCTCHLPRIQFASLWRSHLSASFGGSADSFQLLSRSQCNARCF